MSPIFPFYLGACGEREKRQAEQNVGLQDLILFSHPNESYDLSSRHGSQGTTERTLAPEPRKCVNIFFWYE
jgi:hypothetical protein